MKNMKKQLIYTIVAMITGGLVLLMTPVFCFAEDEIFQGVYAGNISLGGMNETEANDVIKSYVETLQNRVITLYTVDDNEISITPKDIGFVWSNPEVVREAVNIGRRGNVVSRYKERKDLAASNVRFNIEFTVDDNLIKTILQDQCSVYDKKAKAGTVSFENGAFTIAEGQTGMILDIDTSAVSLENFILSKWSGQNTTFQLDIIIDNPTASSEDLALVKDVLGTYHTNYKTSPAARCDNVVNGAAHINGTIIYPGEEFSFTQCVSPFTLDNGYKMAASYASGRVVDSIGGGICQVSSTLYNAVLLAELDVTQRRNHGMIVTYVSPAMDATIAESSGTDFKFANNTDAPIYIEAHTTEDKDLYITIYGHETRPDDRTVEYQSEVVSKTPPGPDVIIQDPSQPIGYFNTQAAHVGYKANCWKIITQNGQTTKELVNTSVYNMAPKYVTVGTATSDPSAAALFSQALSTGDLSVIKSTATTIKNAAAAGESVYVDPDAAMQAYEEALAQQNQNNGESE